MKKKRMLLKVLILCISIFAIYNLIWIANIIYVYYPLTENVPKQESGIFMYQDVEKNYTYNVKFPNYLSFTGNLGVSSDDGSGLIIWPGFLGKNYTYGIILKDGNKIYRFNVDDSLKPLTFNEKEQQIIDNNLRTIEELWNGAKSIWGNEIQKIKQL